LRTGCAVVSTFHHPCNIAEVVWLGSCRVESLDAYLSTQKKKSQVGLKGMISANLQSSNSDLLHWMRIMQIGNEENWTLLDL